MYVEWSFGLSISFQEPVDSLLNAMDDLKMEIINLGHDTMIVDQQKQTMLLYAIDSFNGYPAFGFFYVKKDLLTSVFANFVTYLIILIQFRSTVKEEVALQTTNSTALV